MISPEVGRVSSGSCCTRSFLNRMVIIKGPVDVQIPDNVVGWIIGVFGAVVAWLVRLEARLNARPTRTEQAEMAVKVATNVKSQFDELKRMLERQNEAAMRDRQTTMEHRQWIGDSLADIRTKVAVLRDRTGDDPLDGSGAHRRRL